jgi:membrane protease subunit (stomatin/prohibitin family)
MSNINELISSYLVHKKISILEINAYVVEISKHIQGRLAPTFLESGIELNNFYIDSINIPDDDPATLRLKEALAKKAEMDIIGYTYQQERSFNTMEEAAGNPGNMGVGMMNAGLGMGMGLGFAGPAVDMVNRMTRGIRIDGGGAPAGLQSRACPDCSAMNPEEARFCSGCGRGLQEPDHQPEGAEERIACRSCGKSVAAGAKFCTHCGESMVVKCAGCGHELQSGQKFCGECGRRAV